MRLPDKSVAQILMIQVQAVVQVMVQVMVMVMVMLILSDSHEILHGVNVDILIRCILLNSEHESLFNNEYQLHSFCGFIYLSSKSWLFETLSDLTC